MRKIILLSICLGFYFGAQAAITVVVTNPTNTTPNLANSYSSLANAITAVNSISGMSGPVIFNLAAGTTETAPTGGYILGSAGLNVRTSAINTITFQKSGTGANPLIIGFTPGTSANSDGIWKIQGTDYVTINGIDLQENASNTTTTQLMEWGYAIVKLNATDGTQNISISNCAVTLNKLNTASVGIYGGSVNTAGTLLTPTSAAGINSNVKIQNCTIQNCYIPISITGSSTLAYYDTGLEIGTITGNTISNYGGSITSTCGITVINQNAPSIKYNSISSGTCTTGNITGIDITSCTGNQTISGNTIFSLSSAGGIVYGIYPSGTGSSTIFKNKIFDLTSTTASGTVYGLYINGGTSVIIYNNLIGNLKTPGGTQTAPIPSLTGIYMNSGTVNVYYNTIDLNATSTGTNFGTAAIYASTSATIDLRNSILVNTSIANGTGKTVAYQRSGTTLTTYSNSSNNNLLYAGVPSASNLLMFDGTNVYQTLATYKIAVGAMRDAATITENPVWLSTTGTDAIYLNIDPNRATQIESGGSAITTYTDDFDGNIRNVSTPDIGANEFNGIRPVINTPSSTSLNGFSTAINYASASQTFMVGGSLVNNLLIVAPTGYELRENGIGNYASSITFTPVFGIVPTKTIQVRIAANALAGLASGNVICSSPGVATNQNIAVSGTVDYLLALSVSSTTLSIAKAENSTAVINITSNTNWTATSNQDWLKIGSTGGAGNATLTCTTSFNPTITTRTATVTLKAEGVADKTVTVTQVAGDATLSVSAATANVTKAVNSSATIDITSNTTWTASSDQNWLLVTSGATGNATLTMTTTAANPTIVTRSAIVTLKATGAVDKTVTVNQAVGDPTLSVSANTANVAKAVNSNAIIDVTSNTTWTATSDQSWLTVTSGATGNSTLTMTTTAPNPTIATRSAIVTLKATGAADKIVTVTQAVGDPTLSVSANTASIAKTANSSTTTNVISNTTWTATSDQSWLTVSSGATGNATLTLNAVNDNPFITARTAIVTLKATGVTDKTITVTQAVGDATLGVSVSTATLAKTVNSTATVDIISNSTWAATSNQSWLTVTLGATGNATLTLTANVSNPLITTRIATVTLKVSGAVDKTVTVTQAIGDASLAVSASNVDIAKTVNSTGAMNITSNASWTATSDQSWLTVNSGATGNGTLTCTAVSNNPTISSRIAVVTLTASGPNGTTIKTITATQAVGDATLSVSATTANVSKTANSIGSVVLTSNASWSGSTNQSWLLVKSNGFGNTSLRFSTVSDNPLPSTRQAIITITAIGVADKTITVTQEAGDATLSVSATLASLTKTANSSTSVDVTSNTTWTATSDQSWLTVTLGGTGNGQLTLIAVTANPVITTRTAVVTIKATGVADKTVTVTQSSGDAALAVSSTTASISKTANSTASVNVLSNTTWSATSDQSWLTVTAGATGNASMTLTAITANPLIIPRSAIVTLKTAGVSDKIITVTQSAGDAILQLASATVTIDKTINSSAYINVTSNTTWTATSNQSWLSVNAGAIGDGVLIITSSSTNLTLTPRVATITLKATGTTDKIITVTQEASTPVVTVDNNTVIISPANNYTTSVNITTNTVWTASSDQSWLTVSPVSGNTLTFSATAATVTRQATVTVKAAGVADTRITIVQSPATVNKYQFNMTVTSIATIDKLEIANSNIQLTAFIGDESRGTASLKYEESSKRYMAFLMVWGNADDVNKIITFKSYDPISSKELLAINSTLKFLPENIIGSPTTPYSIDFFDKITNTAFKQLTLKVYLEGLWNGTNMNKCKEYDAVLGDVVDKFAGSVVDTLSVELHNATYSNIAYRITGLQLNQDGTVHSAGKPYIEVPDAASGDYHITIRTRNHLETTTRALVPFSGSTVTYDFTDAVTKAFESDASFTPMKQIAGKWMLYSGNPLPMDPPQVNSDAIEVVDVFDIINNLSDFTSEYGYLVRDLNGDGLVDLSDLFDLALPNYNAGVYFYFPE